MDSVKNGWSLPKGGEKAHIKKMTAERKREAMGEPFEVGYEGCKASDIRG